MPPKNPLAHLDLALEKLDLERCVNVSSQLVDVKAATKAFQAIQDQMLDELARGDPGLVMTEAMHQAEQAAPVPSLRQTFGGIQALLGHQAIDRQRWDAVAAWLDLGGVLSTRPGLAATMAGRLWHQVLAPAPGISSASLDAAMALQGRLRQRLLVTDTTTYRREMLATLVELYTTPPSPTATMGAHDVSDVMDPVIARWQACRAWVDEVLRVRSLGMMRLSPIESATLPNHTVRQAVHAHLLRVEQYELHAVAAPFDAPSSPGVRRRL